MTRRTSKIVDDFVRKATIRLWEVAYYNLHGLILAGVDPRKIGVTTPASSTSIVFSIDGKPTIRVAFVSDLANSTTHITETYFGPPIPPLLDKFMERRRAAR